MAVHQPIGTRDMLLGLLLVLLSGSPLFLPLGNVELTLIPSAVLLAVLYVRSAHPKMKRSDLLVFAIFGALTAIQVASLQLASLYTAMGFFARLFIAFAVVRLTNNSTFLIVRVITVFAILADVMFVIDIVLDSFGLDLAEILKPISISTGSEGEVYAIIQNFKPDEDRGRNAGIFWEPGALSGYCLLALILWGITKDRYSTQHSWVVVVSLVTAILSTFSTTGYVLLPLVLLVSIVPRRSIKLTKFLATVLIVVPILLLALVQIAQLSFVRDKIQDQFFAVGVEGKKWQLNRIGQLVNDVDDFIARPLTGWGANQRIRPSAAELDEVTQTAQGNGLSIFIVQYGLCGFAAFICFGYRNLRRSQQNSALVAGYAMVLLCFTLMGEAFLNYPLFLSLLFIPNSDSGGFPVLIRLIPGARLSQA